MKYKKDREGMVFLPGQATILFLCAGARFSFC